MLNKSYINISNLVIFTVNIKHCERTTVFEIKEKRLQILVIGVISYTMANFLKKNLF